MINKKSIIISKSYASHKKVFKNVDKDALLLCFNNILKNALRYSHTTWKVEIDIQQQYFRVKDYWIGIDQENIEKIFTRHFRENYSWEWIWIWLSLVKRVCDQYSWTVEAKSIKWEFTQITLHF
jgi:signal transduction histidine kinase